MRKQWGSRWKTGGVSQRKLSLFLKKKLIKNTLRKKTWKSPHIPAFSVIADDLLYHNIYSHAQNV